MSEQIFEEETFPTILDLRSAPDAMTTVIRGHRAVISSFFDYLEWFHPLREEEGYTMDEWAQWEKDYLVFMQFDLRIDINAQSREYISKLIDVVDDILCGSW